MPLLALIPAIIAGITALTSVAGTTASVVLGNKQANETEQHNKAIEQIAQGEAISNDIIKNGESTMSDKAGTLARNEHTKRSDIKSCDLPIDSTMSDDELIHRSIEFLTGKGFSVTI